MSKFCILLFTLCFSYVTALKCYKGSPGSPLAKFPNLTIVDCDTDTPGSDICSKIYTRGLNFTMFSCDNKANLGAVCQKDLDTGKCSGVPPEGMNACKCACSTDLCNSTYRLNPAVGVIMVLMGTTVMRFLAQIMS